MINVVITCSPDKAKSVKICTTLLNSPHKIKPTQTNYSEERFTLPLHLFLLLSLSPITVVTWQPVEVYFSVHKSADYTHKLSLKTMRCLLMVKCSWWKSGTGFVCSDKHGSCLFSVLLCFCNKVRLFLPFHVPSVLCEHGFTSHINS